MPRTNYRNIAYRPPREQFKVEPQALRMFFRFCRIYLFPHKWLVLFSALLVSMNTSSVYLMAWYSKVVIDDILVVTPAVTGDDTENVSGKTFISAKTIKSSALPEQGKWSKDMMTIKAAGRTPGAMKKLGWMFFVYTLTIILLNFSARLAERSRINIAVTMTGKLRDDMHKKLMFLSRAYHQRYTPGQLMSRVISDVNVVQDQLSALTIDAMCHVVTFFAGVVILITINPFSALLCLVTMPIYALVYIQARLRLRNFSRELRHTNSWLYSYCGQKIEALKAVLCYAMEARERLNFHRLNSCYLRDAMHQQRLTNAMNRSSGIIASIVTTTIFLLGCRRVMDGNSSIGEMLYVYGTAANLFVPVLGLAMLSTRFNHLFVILQRIMGLLDEPLEMKDPPDAVDFPVPLKSGISLSNVTFSFSPDDDPVLHNVNLHVPAGKWLCIMGASGAGKTSLLGLIGRLYDPVSGEISVDGTPMKKIKIDSFRRHVSMVPQEAEILSASIRDNITYGTSNVEPEQIMAAAKAADVHDFIMSLPVKYETLVGEKGTRLSGGQRQRVSLARALITSPYLLLLDDCTSALDADTERKIQETLAKILRGKTAVIVSQRISMAMRCDRICVLSNGMISETGTHAELLAMNGFYARMHAQQT